MNGFCISFKVVMAMYVLAMSAFSLYANGVEGGFYVGMGFASSIIVLCESAILSLKGEL